MGKKFCPKCKSKNWKIVGGYTPQFSKCDECGYVGIFPEKEKKEKEKK